MEAADHVHPELSQIQHKLNVSPKLAHQETNISTDLEHAEVAHNINALIHQELVAFKLHVTEDQNFSLLDAKENNALTILEVWTIVEPAHLIIAKEDNTFPEMVDASHAETMRSQMPIIKIEIDVFKRFVLNIKS
jgi:hypothetical protein